MKLRHLPNILTGLRIVMTPPIVWALLEQRYEIALVLFFITGWTDLFDGYLAKRFNWQSRLGAILDPIADKLLLVSCIVVLGIIEVLPLWLVMAVLIRDIVILLGGIVFHYFVGRFEITPLLISKLNTVFLLAVIFFSLLDHAYQILPNWFVLGIIYATLVTTIISGISYLYLWGRKAQESTKLKSS